VVPGAGLIYAGEFKAGVIVLCVELALFALAWWLVFIPIHALQIVIAAGTASTCGEPDVDVFSFRRDAAVTEPPESPPHHR